MWPIGLLLVLTGCTSAAAQNLVPNPGFENYPDPIPYATTGVNSSVAWFGINGTPDFYHRDFRPSNGVPANFWGVQEPAEGKGYAGIICHNLQEYLAVRLTEPLVAGVIYEVGFRVSPAGAAAYATDNVGLSLLRDNPAMVDPSIHRGAMYRLKNPRGELIADTLAWKTIQGSIRAEGGERYLVIGNFVQQDPIRREIINSQPTAKPLAYLYVDAVYLRKCIDPTFAPTVTIDTAVCARTPLLLRGKPGADNYYWTNQDAALDLRVRQAGDYLVHNFFGCRDEPLLYRVHMPECDCELSVPSIQRQDDVAKIITSLNVRAYRLQLFDAAGRFMVQTDHDRAGDLRLVLPPAMYFWRARLECTGPDETLFTRLLGGKVLIVD